jgi:alpha-L-fucosidase 2
MRLHPSAFLLLTVLSNANMAARAGPGDAAVPLEKAAKTAAPQGDMVLWYRQPATRWNEAMPLGNGLMGAMVFGGVGQERIALNESTFWSGRPHDYNDPDAIKYFPLIRDLVFAGKFHEAEQMANAHFWGVPASQQCFEPLGDLLLSFGGAEEPIDYRRELDMETGIAKFTYRAGDAVFTREVFVSYPDRVMVIRIVSDKPGKVTMEARFKSQFPFKAAAKPGKMVMDGHWQGPVTGDWIGAVSGDGLRFQVALVARPEGGTSAAAEDRVQISAADAVTLVVTAATSFVNYHDIGGDPAARCEKVLAAIADKDFASLRKRHVADFAALMDRVHLQVGEKSANEEPTDERLRAVRGGRTQPSGPADPSLEALCFQFGRYALVSSSRAGGQPANLQAIWNENVSPPWGSKYTININTQMNYWPTEVCNLSECHQPLFDMLKDTAVTGAATAKLYYGAGGWVAHHNLDLWRGTAPVDRAQFGMWPVGGAWLCRHIWEHYAFTGDKDFLKEYYPVMRGAAQFLLDVMVEEPKHHWLVTPFSMSPEHGYYDGQGRMSFLSPSPTMDVAIIRDLFSHSIEARKLLGSSEPLGDDDFRHKLDDALARIPPYRVNSQGNLQEWIEDWRPGPQGHNVSPQFPFFPGDSIQLRRDPQLAAAEEHWMNSRGLGGGWPAAWGICMWARLERGDRVGAALDSWIARSPDPNMYNSGANQCDATFGFTAGVAESLLQSHAGEISLLPALPSSWTEGSVTGLRARGGFEVSIVWSKGKLQSAEIRHDTGADCKVRYGAKTATFSIKPGARLLVDAKLDRNQK